MRYTSLACVSRKNMSNRIHECELHFKEIVCVRTIIKFRSDTNSLVVFLQLLYKFATNNLKVSRKINILLQETRYASLYLAWRISECCIELAITVTVHIQCFDVMIFACLFIKSHDRTRVKLFYVFIFNNLHFCHFCQVLLNIMYSENDLRAVLNRHFDRTRSMWQRFEKRSTLVNFNDPIEAEAFSLQSFSQSFSHFIPFLFTSHFVVL